MRFLSLGILLFAFWLLLSGHYQTLLIVLGLVSVGICLYLAKRMQITDYEGHRIHLAAGAITYGSFGEFGAGEAVAADGVLP